MMGAGRGRVCPWFGGASFPGFRADWTRKYFTAVYFSVVWVRSSRPLTIAFSAHPGFRRDPST